MQNNLSYQAPVAELSAADRSQFIWKCYAHVIGAVLAFAAISAYLFTTGISERIAAPMLGNWLLVLGAFMLVGWGASHAAHRVQSTGAQYAALAVFVFAEAIIFAPLLYVAELKAPGTIDSDYRGPLGVILINLGAEPFHIAHGDRIAQILFAPVVRAVWEEKDTLDDTDRGAGGFGSTGQK